MAGLGPGIAESQLILNLFAAKGTQNVDGPSVQGLTSRSRPLFVVPSTRWPAMMPTEPLMRSAGASQSMSAHRRLLTSPLLAPV